MAVTAAAGALMGLPAFRVSTWYFALITLGFAEVVSGMLIEWRGLTHSFNGIVGIPKPAIGGHAMGSAELFWLVAALNVGCFAVVANLVHSRFGRALMAVRDNDAAGSASGVSLVRMKLFAFVLSAAITGLAGALYAVQKTVITPDDFTAEFSIFFLVVVVLGGGGSLWGPALGTLVFFYVPELLDSLRSWRLLIYGVVLLLLMRFAPHGLYGAIRTLWGTLRGRLRAPAHPRRPRRRRRWRWRRAPRRPSGRAWRWSCARWSSASAAWPPWMEWISTSRRETSTPSSARTAPARPRC